MASAHADRQHLKMLAILLQIATLLQDKATDDDLAAAMVNIVNSRFLNGSAIPKQVCHWFHAEMYLARQLPIR